MLKRKQTIAFLLMLMLLAGLGTAGISASAESGDTQNASQAEEATEEAFHIVCGVCPVDIAFAENIRCEITKDGTWIYSFDSVYGPFRYVIDAETGKVEQREEPDIEKARQQAGFREPMGYDDLLEKIFDQCPLTFSQSGSIHCSTRPDGGSVVSFDSAYGPFLYVVDPYTGEILEREEPDIQAAEADPDFRERLDVDDVIGSVFKACPIDITTAQEIKASLRADDRWAVTFGSAYGDFLYLADAYGEILEKQEPDMEAAKAQDGFRAPLGPDEVLDAVFNSCPIGVDKMREIKPSPGKDDTWTVTFDSDYGSFLYIVDGYTGEILERNEPDIEAVRAQEGFQEPLSITDIMNKAFDACPLTPDKLQNIKPSQRADGTWAVSFDSEYGPFLYVVDGTTGEILESSVPEIG